MDILADMIAEGDKKKFSEYLKKLDDIDRRLPHGVDDIWPEGISELRNELVWITAAYADRIGLSTYISSEETWPVVYIELIPGGQVSWHVPSPNHNLRLKSLPVRFYAVWDGHTREEKSERIKRYLESN